MDSFKNLIWKYFDDVIPVNDWKWVCLSPNKEVYYLFVDKRNAILNVCPTKEYNTLNYFMMGGYYVYVSGSLMEYYADIFDKDNFKLCSEVFVKWVEKNIPLEICKTDYIGGIKRN